MQNETLEHCFEKHLQKDKKAKYILRIYISNVSIWLDYLNLWNIFSDRVSTIYFPDKKPASL